MPWKRYVMKDPPEQEQMDLWENEGCDSIQVLGPCPAVENKPGAKPSMVYVVYLHRSIIMVGGNRRLAVN